MPTPIQVGTSVDWAGATSRSFSLPVDVTPGSTVAVINASNDTAISTDPLITVTDGTVYTPALYSVSAGNQRTVGLFYRLAHPGGTVNFVASHSAGASHIYGRLLALELPASLSAAPGTAGTFQVYPFNGSSQAISTGSTGALAQALNMMFAIALVGVDPGPADDGADDFGTPAGYTSLLLRQGSSAEDPAISMAWKDTAATTAENASFGSAADTYWAAATAIPFPLAAGGIARHAAYYRRRRAA